MGLTISSRSPAMAYSEGGIWCSTFDEMGRRCWVNNVTGQRTYQFIRGRPVTPTQPAVSSPYVVQQSPMPGPHTAPWGLPSPGYPAPPPPAAAMVPYQAGYGDGAPPVTPAGNGGLGQRLQKYYLRPSSERSWMWNRNQGQ
ncbi:unnamed protein product [Ectocarpus sp. 8 AP-2014]